MFNRVFHERLQEKRWHAHAAKVQRDLNRHP
jgi:hypothetical protein